MVLDLSRTETRDRMVIAAIWLIGLGSVFLVKDLARWDWGQAWPLFVILFGVGGLGSSIFSRQWSPWGAAATWWPLAVIVLGSVLLASTTGTIAVAPTQLLGWWPVLIIGVGAWFLVGALLIRPATPPDALRIPLDGAATGQVRISFGGGELAMGIAEPGALISGTFEGGVSHRLTGPGSVELRPYGGTLPGVWDHPLRWNVGVTGEVPVDLRLDSGANRSTIDLSGLRIRALELRTGASETRVRLPAEGTTMVHVEAGLASVVLELPPGVAARIRSKLALGSTEVDQARFPRLGEIWQSADYDSSPNRADIHVEGGLGSVRVI